MSLQLYICPQKNKPPTFINSTLQLYIPHEKESAEVKESTHEDSISIQANHIHIPAN